MKRLLSLFIYSFFILSTISIYAAPVGNPTIPATLKSAVLDKEKKQGSIGLLFGTEADLTYDRNLENQESATTLNFYGGKGGLVIVDRLFLYGIFGLGNAEQEFKLNAESSNNEYKVKWDTKTGIVWGAGMTLVLYEKEIEVREDAILRIGVDGRYRRIDIDVDKLKIDTIEYALPNSSVTNDDFKYDEWQTALGISCQFGRVIPYGGVKWSDITNGDVKATVNNTVYKRADYSAENAIGIFAGLDLLVADYISLNMEGRFLDETALTIGGAIRF